MHSLASVPRLAVTATCVLAALLSSTVSSPAEVRNHNDFVTEALKHSRELASQHHLVAHVSITTPEGRTLTFQYDQYPGVERVKVSDELAFARKRGAMWMLSNDWGKTGKEVDAEEAMDYDTLVSFIHAPLNSVMETRDTTQGGTFMRLLGASEMDGRERFVFEQSREQPKSDHVYPRFSFERFKNSEVPQALLSKFEGPLYTGDRILMVTVTYDYRVSQASRSRVRLVGPTTGMIGIMQVASR